MSCDPPHLTQLNSLAQCVSESPEAWHHAHCTTRQFLLDGSTLTLQCSKNSKLKNSLFLFRRGQQSSMVEVRCNLVSDIDDILYLWIFLVLLLYREGVYSDVWRLSKTFLVVIGTCDIQLLHRGWCCYHQPVAICFHTTLLSETLTLLNESSFNFLFI